MNGKSFTYSLILLLLGLSMTANRARAADDVAGKLIVFNDNGAWCWYQDERAVVDTSNHTLLIGSVACSDGAGGDTRSGDVDLVTYHLDTGAIDRFVLHHNLQPQDDHNTAAILIRPDGK
jgi:hypothetical protein